MKLRWLTNLYISDGVRENWQERAARMDRGEFDRHTWVICIPVNEKDQLDIRRASALAFHELGERIPLIVGMAESKRAAVGLVEQIAGEWAGQGAPGSLREYVLRKA